MFVSTLLALLYLSVMIENNDVNASSSLLPGSDWPLHGEFRSLEDVGDFLGKMPETLTIFLVDGMEFNPNVKNPEEFTKVKNQSSLLKQYFIKTKSNLYHRSRLSLPSLYAEISQFKGLIVLDLTNQDKKHINEFLLSELFQELSTQCWTLFLLPKTEDEIIRFIEKRNLVSKALVRQTYHYNHFPSVLVSSLDWSQVHLNPILDGCSTNLAVFRPKTQRDFDRLNTRFRRCDLRGQTLDVAMVPFFGLCSLQEIQLPLDGVTETTLIEPRSGFEVEILRYVQRKLHFHPRVHNVQPLFDAKVHNLSQVTWPVEVVANGSVALGACAALFRYQDLKTVSYSRPLSYHEVTFVSSRPLLYSQFVLETIDPSFVLAHGGAFLLLVGLLFGFSKSKICPKNDSNDSSALLPLFAVAVNQSNNFWSTLSLSSRWLVLSWVLCCMIVNQYYTSFFYTSLTVRQYSPPIDTIDDLERLFDSDSDHRTQVITGNRFAYNQRLLTATAQEGGVLFQLGRRLNESISSGNGFSFEERKLLARIAKSDNGKGRRTVAVELRNFLHIFRAVASVGRNPDFQDMNLAHIGRENLWQTWKIWVLPQRSPLIRPLDLIIQTLQETGLMWHWQRRNSFAHAFIAPGESTTRVLASIDDGDDFGERASNTFNQQYSPLRLQDSGAAFNLLGSGLALALVAFLCEVVVSRLFLLKLKL